MGGNNNKGSIGSMPDEVAAQLAECRNDIDALDREMVSLLGRRKDVVERVVALKKKHRLPVHHPAREEDLISDRRARAEKSGLNPDHIEELFRCILRQSRMQQTAHIAKKAVRPGATVLLVGASGGMGQYFQKWFGESGYRVRPVGRKNWHQLQELCDGVDLAIISVPIDVTEAVIKDVAPYLPAECILTDLTSIKGPPMAAMLNAHKGPVVGLHPLFGPTTSTMDKQIIAVTPGRNHPACEWLIEQFDVWGAIMVQTTADEHDEIMAIVQSLRHFATFVFGQFLWNKRVDLSRTLEFSSPIYRLELGMVGRLFAQDASLYSEIIFASPQRRQLLKDFVACMTENLSMLDKGDKSEFNEQFQKIADWFGPFGEQAMRESTFLIEKLIERF